jgi:hypothetical protein
MISPVQSRITTDRRTNHNFNHNPMMTIYCTRGNLSRSPHKNSNQGLTMRNNLIYYLRIILLSILPQKPFTNYWTRIHLTTNRNFTIQPLTNPITKYSNSTCLRGDSYMSSPWAPRKLHTKYTRFILDSNPRNLLYNPTSIWIHISFIHNRRLKLWVYILCNHQIPWPSHNYCNYVPVNMLIQQLNLHFSSNHHFGFEAASWYWHFVDVVWLFLYISIYWWGRKNNHLSNITSVLDFQSRSLYNKLSNWILYWPHII